MLHIAFCDDELSDLHLMQEFLDDCCAQQDLETESRAYLSALDLLADLERGVRFDILFLDVMMPGMTGMEAAAEIRNRDRNVKIIFLTASAEFAVDSYRVDAYYYLLKPCSREEFCRVAVSAMTACRQDRTDGVVLRCKDGITRVELSRLEYCEIRHRTLFLHLTDGSILESNGSMDELFRQLQHHARFLRPHRSYFVNLEQVRSMSYHAITMSDGAEIPIPRGKYREIKDRYLEFAFENRQVMV